MNNDLKNLYQIQKVLKASGYYDISRISQEILTYSKDSNVLIEDILERIQKDEPWEYISGKAEFRNLTFKVDSSTLIPRIETEKLVEYALEELKANKYTTIVDVGTGSGCILISLIKAIGKGSYRYIGTDISAQALEIAKSNAKTILVNPNIEWYQTDLINDIDFKSDGKVLFLGNLPYIPTEQYEKLERSVINYEPKNALDGGSNGIMYYQNLFKQIQEKSIKGKGIFEIEPSTLPLFKNMNPLILKDQYERDRFLLISFN